MTKDTTVTVETVTRYVFAADDIEKLVREKYSLPEESEFDWDRFERWGAFYVTVRQKEEHEEPNDAN
jgi:hypothetical protein